MTLNDFERQNNNIHICIAPYGRNFRGAGPGSVLVGVRRGKSVSLGEEKCPYGTYFALFYRIW